MNAHLHDIIAAFQSVDDDMRLELLLDFAKKLPPIPRRLHDQRDAGVNRVPECMTPVFLWMEPDDRDDTVRLFIDVADEAPTVRGMLSIIVRAYDGQPASDFRDLPSDLVHRLGLQHAIRMNRLLGLNAILARIRRQAQELAVA